MSVNVQGLRVEYLSEPIGLDVGRPRLSWTLHSDARHVEQTSYQIKTATTLEGLETDSCLWDTGETNGSDRIQVPYDGPALEPSQRYWWKVRVETNTDAWSEWSRPAYWETGLLGSAWSGAWLQALETEHPRDDYRPCSYFRRQFEVAGGLERARLYATALGVYEPRLNGKKVGNDVLRPGWTDYAKLAQYQTYDVTTDLVEGNNALGLILGDGWFAGYLGVACQREVYGSRPLVRAMLRLDYQDGTTAWVVTDQDWEVATGAILSADLLKGEVIDARREPDGWDRAGFAARGWRPAETASKVDVELVAEATQPVRVIEEMPAARSWSPVFQNYVYDLGQNIVGWARLHVSGKPGIELTVRHGEMLTDHGTVYTENLRMARATERYITRGGADEVFEPHFTFHGFRYVQVEAPFGTELADGAVTGQVIHNDMPVSGSFDCDNELLTQIWKNCFWTQRGNFLEVPTDCPQRNERLGWLGDARIFSDTARLNYDVAAFFTKWVRDIRMARNEEGVYRDVAPWVGIGKDGLERMRDGAPGWADAGIFIPYLMYLTYGDVRVIEENYDAMSAFLDLIHKENPSLLRTERTGVNWGDWLSLPHGEGADDLKSGVSDSVYSTTPRDQLATAFFARSAFYLSRMAAAIGRDDDAKRYAVLANDIKETFQRTFISPDGGISDGTQTAYAIALAFDLYPDELRERGGEYLAAAIRDGGGYLTTGIVGTQYVLQALTMTGHCDLAFELALREEYPSWGYTVRNGATTIWERWDGWTEERGFQDIRMNSFNHYALGAIGAWIYETVGGLALDPEVPGARRFIVDPHEHVSVQRASTRYESMRGPVVVDWSRTNGQFVLAVEVPPTATAEVHLPAGRATESGRPLDEFPFTVLERDGRSVVEVGSGRYEFTVGAA